MMPTRVFIVSCRSSCRVYGFSAQSPLVGPSNGASASLAASSTASSDTSGRSRQRAHVVGGAQPGAAAEHQQVRQRVAAEPVGAVHAARAFARGEQPRRPCGAGVGVDLDAAHDVVAGRADFHRLLGDVDLGQLHELVIHRRQPALDLLGGQPRRDVEEHAAVRRVAAGLHLGVDRTGHLVAGQQIGSAACRVVVLEPLVGLFDGFRRTGP